MALFIEFPIDHGSNGATGIGFDLRGCSQIDSDEGAQRIGIIGGISDDVADAA